MERESSVETKNRRRGEIEKTPAERREIDERISLHEIGRLYFSGLGSSNGPLLLQAARSIQLFSLLATKVEHVK